MTNKSINITKKEISEHISEQTGLKQGDVKTVINLFFDQVKEHLKNGNHIELRGFGRFKVKSTPARKARNPKTGESCKIPSKVRPFCQISQSIKEYVNA